MWAIAGPGIPHLGNCYRVRSPSGPSRVGVVRCHHRRDPSGMIRTFRYPLHPTREQEGVLTSWLAACQQLYNAALEERRDAWRRCRVNVTRFDQQKELTELRAEMPEWKAVPVDVARSALARIDRAFDGFFRRVRSGQKPGFPRFRSSERYNSFDLESRPPRVDRDRVHLPKLGPVKFHCYRDMRGAVRYVTIGRTARGWYVAFGCDLGEAPTKSPARNAVGIDLGIESFATLSTGERVSNPRFFCASERVLARRQRSLARKRRGSNSRRTAGRLVARAHERVRNQRIDFARKLAAALFARFDMVVHEDLQIARMVRGDLAKVINDAAWGHLLRALQSKAEGAGKWCVPVDSRGTSQTCPACGAVAKKELSERDHRCGCGFSAHRDHAAAQVILGRGLRQGQSTEVSGPTDGS